MVVNALTLDLHQGNHERNRSALQIYSALRHQRKS